jgi:dynein heavy chain
MEQVKTVSEVVRTMKNNLQEVSDALKAYNKPLLIRKTKPLAKDEFDREHKNFVKEKYTEIKDGGKQIHTLVKDTNKVLKVSNASNDWRAYVDFVNNVVVDGLSSIVFSSLEFLHEQIDPESIAKNDLLPMIEIKLDLVSIRDEQDVRADHVKFIPDLKESSGKGIRDLVNSWIGSFFNVSTIFRRLDNDGTYLREIHADHGVKMLMAMINETLETNEQLCVDLQDQYQKYKYLWTTDLAVFFEEFLADAQITTPAGQQLTGENLINCVATISSLFLLALIFLLLSFHYPFSISFLFTSFNLNLRASSLHFFLFHTIH